MTYAIMTDAPIVEDARTQLRRRLQQKRCLVCGARQLANNTLSYFCPTHLITHRFCSQCEMVRLPDEHGKDARCRACNRPRGLANYYADRDRTLYRIRLAQMARRRSNRLDQIFQAMRQRIALAELVRQTPTWSWPRRAALLGVNAAQLARNYREQCAGRGQDADASERGRRSTR